MELAGGLLTFLLVLFFGLVLYMPVYKNHYDTYLVRLKIRAKEPASSVARPKESFVLSVFRAAGKCVLGYFPGLTDKRSLQLLILANYRSQDHLHIFAGIRSMFVGLTVLPMLLCTAGSAFLFCLPAAVCAWMIPNFFLAARAKKRQQLIMFELPTIVDLMIVCAQAGLGLLMSIEKVSRETKETCPVLADEFEQFLNDVKLFAKPSSVALHELGERCDVDALNSFTSTLISCETKGAELSYPLKQIGAAIRDQIKRKREEEASKTPVKMVPVIMFFVMPLILCPMLGPAIIIILETIGPAMGLKPPGGH